MNEKNRDSSFAPFVAGAIFGATIALALNHKQGRKLTSQLVLALKDALEDLEKKHPDLANLDWPLSDKPTPAHHNFPPPPKGYPTRNDQESYFERD